MGLFEDFFKNQNIQRKQWDEEIEAEWRNKFRAILGDKQYYENTDLIEMVDKSHRKDLYDILCIHGDIRLALPDLDLLNKFPEQFRGHALNEISNRHYRKMNLGNAPVNWSYATTVKWNPNFK